MLAKIMERNFNCVLSFTEKYAVRDKSRYTSRIMLNFAIINLGDSAESEFFIVN